MEARLLETSNVLLVLSQPGDDRLRRDFCGSVFTSADLLAGAPDVAGKAVYLCGDIKGASGLHLPGAERVSVIRQLSHDYDEGDGDRAWSLVDLGRVPVRVHGLGVYYPCFFDAGADYFSRICAEHTFQSLTESTKPGRAHRTGIYLTPVTRDGDSMHFRLLRCSTNLAGPTDNFRATDRYIVDALNQEATLLFRGAAPLNHVLAQVYHNTPATSEQRQAKARISAHADKTKDMPANGIMAFCTFYDRLDKLRRMARDLFDYGHRDTSGLTRLCFRLKESLARRPGPLPVQFTLTLHPNSVFFMPLSTNRLYTHEIQSSTLDAALLPTRLGYVVRCSNAEAVHAGGRTFLKADGRLAPLEPPTEEGMAELRRLYAAENKTEAFIDYGEEIFFSMNAGDYLAPRA